jgi:transcriptional regulator with XRE-family HTH domain
MSSIARIADSAYGAETLWGNERGAWAPLDAPSFMLMLGEQERRDRFGYALSQALRVRKTSERELAKALGIDARQVAKWRSGKGLPDIYTTRAIERELRLNPKLFEDPPPVPKPPEYPIEDYLLGAIDEGVQRGLGDLGQEGEDDDEHDGPPPPRRSKDR